MPCRDLRTDPIKKRFETNERLSGFLGSLSPGLWKEDEDEDEAEETNSAVQKEGGSVAEGVLQIPERLGDDEPAEVGCQVGQGVSPTAGPWN